MHASILARWAAATVAAVLLGTVHALPVKAGAGQGVLYGTTANTGFIIEIDTATGARNTDPAAEHSLGGIPLPSLAVDPTDGTIYFGPGAGIGVLFRVIDLATGDIAPVGDLGLGQVAIGGLDFDADGNLFASINLVGSNGTGSDTLFSINKLTGEANEIGPFGTCDATSCTIDGMEAIAFDSSGQLWGAVRGRQTADIAGLYTIDVATGAATFVAPLLEATSGTPASGGITSLQFACDGTLYGGTARDVEPAEDGGFLVSIDPATGQFSFIGTQSTTGDITPDSPRTSLGGLAFAEPCAPTTNHFLCYEAKTAWGEAPFVPVTVALADQFGESEKIVARPIQVCTAVDKNGEGVPNPDLSLTCYELKRVRHDYGYDREARHDGRYGPWAGRGHKRRHHRWHRHWRWWKHDDMPEIEVTVDNQFGVQPLEIEKPQTLCVPSSMEVLADETEAPAETE